MYTNFHLFKKGSFTSNLPEVNEKGIYQNPNTGNYNFNFDEDKDSDIMPLKLSKTRSKVLERDGVKYSYYYAYQYDNRKNTDILKSIKYLNKVSDFSANDMVIAAVEDIQSKYDLHSYSTLISPKSSSLILDIFVNVLAEQGLIENTLQDAFVKSSVSDIQFDYPAIDKLPESVKKQVLKLVQNIKSMTTEFKLKDVFTRYRKFIKNFIKLDTDVLQHVKGQKVILMDDYRTTGTTLKEMTNILIGMQPAEILIILLIKVN